MQFLRGLVSFITACAFVAAQSAAVAQDSAATARNTAATIGQDLQPTINSTVTDSAAPKNVGGYDSNTTFAESDLFDKPDNLAGAGASAAQSSASYSLSTKPLPVTSSTSNIDVSAAKQIEANPMAYAGISTSGSQGDCKGITTNPASGATYYASCHIGSTEVDSSFTCAVGWNDVVAKTYSYSCEKKTVWGVNTPTGGGAPSRTNLGTITSCGQLEALSYCKLKTSSTVVAAETYGVSGFGGAYAPPVIEFPSYSVDKFSASFDCSQSVAVAPAASQSYRYWSSVDAGGSATIGTMSVTADAQATGSSSTLTSSSIDESACQAQIGSISCPSGSSLQNGKCVSSVPATPTYSCPIGWSLSGSTCTLQQASNASVSGYSCPANYRLSGTSCVSTQPAGITGYTCPSGYTLNGTTCTQTLTQAPRSTGFTCPIGWTLSGSICYHSDTQPASASYSCPAGYALSGTTCTLTSQAAAVLSYTCPSGWTLNGSICEQKSTYQAKLTYTCPSTWTLNGSTCSSSSTYAAQLSYSCPAGWDLQGSTCSRSTYYAPAVSYSCPSGWTLSGSTCTQSSSYPATVTFSCGSGWTLSGSTCSQAIYAPATSTPVCPSGWTLSGSTCSSTVTQPAGSETFCAQGELAPFNRNLCRYYNTYGNGTLYCNATLNGQILIPSINAGPYCYYSAPTRPVCSAGWTLNGTMCFSVTTQPASSVYVCPPGMAASASDAGQCVGTSSQPANANYSCGDGSSPIAGVCYLSSSQAASAAYSCPQGGSFDGSQCKLSESQAATAVYGCPSGGSLVGNTCVVTNSQPASQDYSCPNGGSLNGTTCEVTNLQPAQVVYGCPAGSTLSGTMCLTTDTRTAAVQYACPANYALQGSSCVLSESTNATPVLACPDGYILDGSICRLTLTLPATERFACAVGYTLDGNVCTSTVPATIDGYACPSGYTMSGTTCVVSAVQPATSVYTCPGGGVLVGTECVTSSEPQSTTGLTCQNPVETCTDPSPSTRTVDGASVTHSCWAWSRSYQCAKLTPQNDCAELESKPGCKFDHEECLEDGCYTKTKVYICPAVSAPGTTDASVCTGDIYCIDGSCTKIEREASPDFADALTAINAMGDADGQFDPNSMTIFKGTATGCHKPLFGLVNCCAGKSSGMIPFAVGAAALALSVSAGVSALLGLVTNFLTLFLCSQEEMTLDVKDRMGVCHYVGQYCSQKLLFVCASIRHTYCCFQTKLAKVIHEQGRPQIGKSWGTAKNPDCSGFTVDEFSRLDLSTMDFTEVYGDFTSAVSVPESLKNATEIQSRVQAFYAQHKVN